MADYEPIYAGQSGTYTATVGATAVVGGQLLKLSADNTVVPAAAITDPVMGVAAQDAGVGSRVTVWPLRGIIHELVIDTGGCVFGNVITASGGTAGRAIVTAAPAASAFVGVAMSTATIGNKFRCMC